MNEWYGQDIVLEWWGVSVNAEDGIDGPSPCRYVGVMLGAQVQEGRFESAMEAAKLAAATKH